MATGIYIQESGTFQATNFAESFFNRLPTDSRYLNVYNQVIDPSTSIQGASQIKFVLPAQIGPFVYHLHDHFLRVKVRMVMDDGSKIKNIARTPSDDDPSPFRLPKVAPVSI